MPLYYCTTKHTVSKAYEGREARHTGLVLSSERTRRSSADDIYADWKSVHLQSGILLYIAPAAESFADQ